MQDAAFLDVAAFADHDRFVVAAYRDVEPDAGSGLDMHLANQCGTVGDVGGGIDEGCELPELVDGHGVAKCCTTVNPPFYRPAPEFTDACFVPCSRAIAMVR